MEKLDDHKEERSVLVTLVIGGVDVPNVLIDSGASCYGTADLGMTKAEEDQV